MAEIEMYRVTIEQIEDGVVVSSAATTSRYVGTRNLVELTECIESTTARFLSNDSVIREVLLAASGLAVMNSEKTDEAAIDAIFAQLRWPWARKLVDVARAEEMEAAAKKT